ncbi:MAG: hydroxyethylthiazole kinase [Clostridiales bacterium]|nr:hydroxyethylthiazole kinase [Clostridiales bacterium]
MVSQIVKLLDEVRANKPLIHNITNYVTVNDCANIILAIGASPVMADDLSEVEDIVSISSALVLNIGTLNKRTVESMIAAGKKANSLGIPVILDPVGVGASSFRNETAAKIIKEVKIDILRGNMSEIRFISGMQASTKGVDASDADLAVDIDNGIKTAKNLAKQFSCVVAITGAVDIVSDGSRTVTIHNGHKMLSQVTGTGCMTTALVGAFCGASKDDLIAAVSGILSMGIAGELAYETAEKKGTGSFRVSIIDQISRLDSGIIERMSKINEY